MSSFYLEFNLAHIITGLFVWMNEEDYMKKKEILNIYKETDDKLQDIIELTTFIKIENDIQQLENEYQFQEEENDIQQIENNKNIEFILGDNEPCFINPDIFTPQELQMLFLIIPLEVIHERIINIYNKVYKIKGLKSFIFDKHIYNTIVIFNQEIQTELKSELAISFTKLILSRIPQKYITNV